MSDDYPTAWPDRSSSSENVVTPKPAAQAEPAAEPEPEPAAEPEPTPVEPVPASEAEPLPEPPPDPEPEPEVVEPAEAEVPAPSEQHAAGDIDIPDDVDVLEGEAGPTRRLVALVVAKFNGEITTRLLESALGEFERIGVERSQLTIVPVPGAFELPLAAMALAKTRRSVCDGALGCGIRGETPHFEYVASEAASGLQLAALETGIPVSFGVLTCETKEQAEARVDKGADAVRAALEMADLFSQLRQTAGAQA